MPQIRGHAPGGRACERVFKHIGRRREVPRKGATLIGHAWRVKKCALKKSARACKRANSAALPLRRRSASKLVTGIINWRRAGADGLDRHVRQRRIDREAEDRQDVAGIIRRQKLRFFLRHDDVFGHARHRLNLHANRADLEFKGNRREIRQLQAARIDQREDGGDGGTTGQRDFFGRSE